jgi:Putative zinc-finger
MTMPVGCEDKDALVAYLYDEVEAGERARIEAHLALCAACRTEVNELRAVRIVLPAWAPPERDLGFAIVDRDRPARRPWALPAWGLAAAATLVLAAAAAIAKVEVSYDANGFSVRTGWSRDQATGPAQADNERAESPANGQAEWRAELTSLEQRLRDEFRVGQTRTASTPSTPEAAEVLRRVRTLIGESETRQQRELALRIAQVLRDFDRQRQADLVRIQYGFGQLERSTAADREMVNHLVRVSSQQR